MQAESQRTPPAYGRISPRVCPSCQCALVRDRRRTVDRLRSLVRPIKRYRCENFACQWVGNIASTKATGDLEPPTHRPPLAFIVHMALAAVGVVVVIVVAAMLPANWADDEEPRTGSSNDLGSPAQRTVTQAESR